MKFLTRLAAGDIALWCAFWLIGMPFVLLWDLSGGCTVVGCGIAEPLMGAFLLVLFAFSSVAIPFVSVAIWRSASRYPRASWRQRLIVFAAKLFAAISGTLAAVGLAVLLYMVFIFAYAAFDRA
ncbi:MAG: hypothetical protein ABSE22_20150 [Xanthobacteraceae bacterium]|jgi:hypothetical protein